MKAEEHGARKRADLNAAGDLLTVAAPIDASACKEGLEEKEEGRVSGEGGGGWGGRWEGGRVGGLPEPDPSSARFSPPDVRHNYPFNPREKYEP